jgi:hypothetical protein
VSDALAPIAEKLRPLVRLLSSDRDGEVIAAARALIRTLKGAKLDIHALADSIGQANGKLSEAEMLKLYAAGYAARIRAAEQKHQYDDDGFTDACRVPTPHEMARWCQQRANRLRENERQFINDIASRTVWRAPTERQRKWLESIFLKLGGRV